jgi:deoxyribodipyrimidine photo-lyase
VLTGRTPDQRRDGSGLSDRPAIYWFRRDLRLADNPTLIAAVAAAASERGPLLPLYVWEPRERRRWAPGAAARWWLWHSLTALDGELRARGSQLAVLEGDPAARVPELAAAAGAHAVYWAAGLEPEEAADDAAVAAALRAAGISAIVVPQANLLFDPAAVRTKAGRPYTVFTPYWRTCLALPEPEPPLPAPKALPTAPGASPAAAHSAALASAGDAAAVLPGLRDEAVRPWSAGFADAWTPGEAGAQARLARFADGRLLEYAEERDRPASDGTSRLSPHLHWGELSGRQVWHAVAGGLAEAGLELETAVAPPDRDATQAPGPAASAGAYLRQLGWREFGHHLLASFPELPERPLSRRFEGFPWRRDPAALEAWRRGRTGVPFVDAGMRELWATGWMHNRARLVTGSFLVKDLLLPWTLGEDWFWDTLVDADLADNALGWQWVAGCGADAAPYFRILNPETQARRYDADGAYRRRWAGETSDAPALPIVDHRAARARALAAYDIMRESGRQS